MLNEHCLSVRGAAHFSLPAQDNHLTFQTAPALFGEFGACLSATKDAEEGVGGEWGVGGVYNG